MNDQVIKDLSYFLENGDIDNFLGYLREMSDKEGISSLSKKTGITREALYKILDYKGNPRLDTLFSIMKAFDLCFQANVKSDAICDGPSAIRYNSLSSTHPSIAEQWHPTRNDPLSSNDVIVTSKRKIWWQCQNGHEWLESPCAILLRMKKYIMSQARTEQELKFGILPLCIPCNKS